MFFTIRSKLHEGMVMDVSGGELVINTLREGDDSQMWELDGFYIRNKQTGTVIDIEGGSTDGGTQLCVWEQGDKEWQKWCVDADGTIRSHAGDNMVLDIPGGSEDGGARLCIWSKHGNSNQCWYLVPAYE